jgi:uroporphyrinogen-III synthase
MQAPVPALILTRPEAASRQFLQTLNADLRARLQVVISPVLRIVPVGGPVDPGAARGIVFTSANAVQADLPRDLPCFCVGAATTRAARAAGWDAQQSGTDADSLVARLLADRLAGPLLHLRGRHARGDVAARLSAGGIACAEQVVYDQLAQPLSGEALTALGDAAILPVFSPRSAELIAPQLPAQGDVRIAALSPAVAAIFTGLSARQVHVCARPDAGAMRDLVEKLANRGIRLEGRGSAH